jgi:hypothetical protein
MATPVPTTVSKKVLSGTTVTILILTMLVIGLVTGLKEMDPSSMVSWSVTPVPQPQGRCDDSFAQDDLGTYNFAQSLENRVRIEPGSTTKLCYGSLVSIPEDRWKTWGAQFVPPAGQKERCVAWFSYIYPDHSVRVIGPRYEQGLGIGDMPMVWRVATNCPIEYYRW